MKTKPTPQRLDVATAKKVLAVDLSNVLRKVRSGKPLTRYERELVALHAGQEADSAPAPEWPPWGRSIAEAARLTGISRQTLHAWRKEKCPAFKANGRVQLHELRTWIEAHDKKVSAPSATESARQRVLRAQAQRLEFRTAVEMKKYVLVADLLKCAGPTLTSLRDLYYQKCGEEMPLALAGVDVAQGRIIGQRFAGELCDKSQEIFRAWPI